MSHQSLCRGVSRLGVRLKVQHDSGESLVELINHGFQGEWVGDVLFALQMLAAECIHAKRRRGFAEQLLRRKLVDDEG
jgi:hypothetical protein